MLRLVLDQWRTHIVSVCRGLKSETETVGGRMSVNAHCKVVSVYRPNGSAPHASIKCHQADKEPQYIELNG